MLTVKMIVKEFPALEGFSPNGSSDFNTVAEVLGSRNPKLVWAVINAFAKEAKKQGVSPAISRLMAKLDAEE